ncbi:MAG: hypothetical protein PSX36_15645 [bacterium]|nr:hypothetical protein [bacterium]
MKLKPKVENNNIGFHYTVSQEQIDAHRKRTPEEILEWLETTSKFIYELQTPAERQRLKKAKNFKW